MSPDINREQAVFIVEDSPLVSSRMAVMLGGLHGIRVVGLADSATSAIEGIRKLQPDIVTLDLRLREGSGLDVLKSVKGGEHPPIVLILTNYTDIQYRNRCRAFGADYFFDKTMEFLQAIDLIERVVTRPTLELSLER